MKITGKDAPIGAVSQCLSLKVWSPFYGILGGICASILPDFSIESADTESYDTVKLRSRGALL